MIGYKCTDMNGCCRDFKFEVGKTYTKDTPKEELECRTDKVFHFCRNLYDIDKESNYKLTQSRLFEIISGDFVRDGDMYGTNSITILREIEGDEKLELINSGIRNSGNRNSGDWNSGDWNSGIRNSGDLNSGDLNSGDWNSGNRNSGNWNSGNWNSGNMNSGNWNSGNMNSGFFNSDEPCVRVFNKRTDKKIGDIEIPSWCFFNLTVWVSHDTATEEEKQKHKAEIEICGGFLKTINYKDAWRHAWNKASIEERKKLFDLPNWDNQVFKEITGIDAETEIVKEIKEK